MFQLDHTAEIRAMNIAKGKGEDAPVCVTIGLDFEGVDSSPAATALGCQQSDLDSLFNEKGEVRYSGINHIDTWAEFEDEHELKMLGFTCKIAKISKIRLKARHRDNFDLSCNIQIQDPPDHVLESIATHLHNTRTVRLLKTGGLPLADPEEHVKEAA